MAKCGLVLGNQDGSSLRLLADVKEGEYLVLTKNSTLFLNVPEEYYNHKVIKGYISDEDASKSLNGLKKLEENSAKRGKPTQVKRIADIKKEGNILNKEELVGLVKTLFKKEELIKLIEG